ncbi:MAG: hypothetical protein VW683_14250 [Betaproteobacteria bacterium]
MAIKFGTVDNSTTEYEPKQSVLIYGFDNAILSKAYDGTPCDPCVCFRAPNTVIGTSWGGTGTLPAGADDAAHAKGLDNTNNKSYLGDGDPYIYTWKIIWLGYDAGEI